MNEFIIPPRNFFAAGCIEEILTITKILNGKKALLITDKNLVLCGVTQQIENILINGSIDYVLFDNVSSNPTKTNVYEGLALLKKYKCDFIIGLGGGSPNDCAKAISILATNEGELENFAGFNQSINPGCPIISINTTAGTASEISRAYLITDEEKKEKIICKDIHALPYAAINDPLLMLGLPSHITAQTGMDALAHALESYVCNIKTTMTQELSASAAKLVFHNLREVIAEPLSIKRREDMIYAQTLAGMAFCNSGVGIAHSIAHALGATYHLGHGLCTALVLPSVMRFNAKNESEEYANLSRTLFPLQCQNKEDIHCAEILIQEVENLSNDIGTSVKLSELGITVDHMDDLIDKALRDGNTGRNPFQPSREDMRNILSNIT